MAWGAPAREEVLAHDAEGGEKSYDNREELCADIEEEEVVVADAHAVVDPGAVMVETFDATLACRAVAGPRRPDHQAVWAKLPQVLVDLYYLRELDVRAQVPWISDVSQDEESKRLEGQSYYE